QSRVIDGVYMKTRPESPGASCSLRIGGSACRAGEIDHQRRAPIGFARSPRGTRFHLAIVCFAVAHRAHLAGGHAVVVDEVIANGIRALLAEALVVGRRA